MLGIIYSHATWMPGVRGRKAAREACSEWMLRTCSSQAGVLDRQGGSQSPMKPGAQTTAAPSQASLQGWKRNSVHGGPSLSEVLKMLFCLKRELMFAHSRVAHWDPGGRRFWALSVEHRVTPMTGNRWQTHQEATGALSVPEVRDQTGWGEGPETPPPNWDTPFTFGGS